jgi:catechol 2,3-dioxygenase-like lactoylglutathione lyase family enzyme
MIVGIHHVQITIPRGAEAAGRAFYCGLLNLPEIEKPDSLKGRGGFWVQVGDRQLHIGTEDGFDRLTTKGHIAYQVDDLEHWRAVLPQNGIVIEEQIPIPGYHRFEFRDPFGNRVEMIQPDALESGDSKPERENVL